MIALALEQSQVCSLSHFPGLLSVPLVCGTKHSSRPKPNLGSGLLAGSFSGEKKDVSEKGRIPSSPGSEIPPMFSLGYSPFKVCCFEPEHLTHVPREEERELSCLDVAPKTQIRIRTEILGCWYFAEPGPELRLLESASDSYPEIVCSCDSRPVPGSRRLCFGWLVGG